MRERVRGRPLVEPKIPDIDFIDFGCGDGGSVSFASSVVRGQGIAIDISEDAVLACSAKGILATQGDILAFDKKNVSLATFAIDVLPEMPGRVAFERALANVVAAARNFAVLQHSYFDADVELAARGYRVDGNFGKKVLYKPTIADYLNFAERHHEALSISGVGILASGSAPVSPRTAVHQPEADAGTKTAPEVRRWLRVIIGRKETSRFRDAIKRAGSGDMLFMWERG